MKIPSLDSPVKPEYNGAAVVQAADGAGYELVMPRSPMFSTAAMCAVAYVIDARVVKVDDLLIDSEDEDDEPEVPVERTVIVADIDGCCVHSDHRLPFLFDGDLPTYHKHHIYDRPISQGVAVYRKFLTDPDFQFYFVTDRDEAAREYTLKQLQQWVHPSVQDHQLLMRPMDKPPSKVHDTALKPWLLRQRGITPEQVFLVFEDRTAMVKMWRTLGVVCYQTAFGDF